MSKQPTTSIGSSKGQEIGGGGAGAGTGFVKGDRSNRRFLSLRDSTLRYDSLQTLSAQSDTCVNASDSVKHPASPSPSPFLPPSLSLSPCLSPTPSLSPFEPPSALVYSPMGMLKVLGDKATPKSSYAQSDCPSPYPSPFMISPTPSPLPTTAAATAASPAIGKSRTLSSAISSMFSKKATQNKDKSPVLAKNDTLSFFGRKKKDRYLKEANGVLNITPSSTVTTRSINSRHGTHPFITLATAKETLCVCYEHMDPPPSLPFGHQGYEDLYSSAGVSKSVDSVHDTVHALWTKELRRSIAQQTRSKWRRACLFFIISINKFLVPVHHYVLCGKSP